MKGQVFIVTSILILLALFLSRSSTKSIDIKHDETFYQSFSNIKDELIKTIDLSLINQEETADNLDDFIDFSTEVYKKKGYIENVNYSISTGLSTTVYLNVSLTYGNSYLLESLIINRTVYT